MPFVAAYGADIRQRRMLGSSCTVITQWDQSREDTENALVAEARPRSAVGGTDKLEGKLKA